MWRFDSETDPGEWKLVETPVSVTLRDVADSANGPVAVGNKGYVIGRGSDGWGVIVDDGPAAESNALHAVSSTADGKRVWFAGASGALGYYDIPTGDRENYSEPADMNTTFTSLTVAGTRGEEKFLIGDASGNVLPGDIDGGRADWGWPSSPSGGTSIKDVTHDANGYGYAVDNNSNVYMTTEDDGWHRIGVESGNSFYSLAENRGAILAGGGNAKVYELEEDDRFPKRGEYHWTPYDLGSFTVYGLDVGEHADLACGGSGNLHVRLEDGAWHRVDVDFSSNFFGVLASTPMVAVGGGGTIAERRPEDRWGGSDGEDGSGTDSGGSSTSDTGGSDDGSTGDTSDDSTQSSSETSDTAEETDDDTTEGYDDDDESSSDSGSTSDSTTSDSTSDSTSGSTSDSSSDGSTSSQGDEEPAPSETSSTDDDDPIEEAYDADEEVDADADEIEEDLDDDAEYDADAGDQDVDMYEEDNDADEVTDADSDQIEEDLDGNDSTGDPQNDPSDPSDAPDDGQNDPEDLPDDGDDSADAPDGDG